MIGTELGSYRVVESIGKGGMASVYLGEHTTLGHRVAIKVLHHAGRPIAERRFLDEARAIAAVRHPGIVQLFDYGRGPDGRAYIAMELLEGETLRARLRRGALSLEQALVFGRQIASAVGAAHDVGIVHRDLKPDNIFLVPDPEVRCGERVRVLDFGVAKNLNVARDPSEMTATGVLVGTPAYMSPEQCRGDTSIDHRSDIYSFGVVFYRMLTGELPYESAATGELIGKHLFEEIPDPSALDPGVSPKAVAIVGRCLAKEPDQRYGTMVELAEELKAAADEVYGRRRRSSSMIAPMGPPPDFPAAAYEGEPRPTRFLFIDGIEEDSPARWLWPLSLGGSVAVGVFVALMIARSGNIPLAEPVVDEILVPDVAADDSKREPVGPDDATGDSVESPRELAASPAGTADADGGVPPEPETARVGSQPVEHVAATTDEANEIVDGSENELDNPPQDEVAPDELAIEEGSLAPPAEENEDSSREVASAGSAPSQEDDNARPSRTKTERKRPPKTRGTKSSEGKTKDGGKNPETIKVPTLF